MAGSVNKVILVGNLGREPEIRSMGEGREVANLAIATSEQWKDKNTGERREKTEWHRVSVFSQGLVGICKQYLKKGSKLYIEGALQTRKWTDSNGVEKYTTEIVLQNYVGVLIMLDGKRDSGGENYGGGGGGGDGAGYGGGGGASSFGATSSNPASAAHDFDDDIPF